MKGVETARGEAKDRTLSDSELSALAKVLDQAEPKLPAAVTATRLLVLTGLRREEACALRWEEVDLGGRCLRLKQTKTGRSVRPIGKAAFQILANWERSNEEWVFPSRNGEKRADLKKAIAGLFDAAGLKDARSHDLRRTFASIASDEGYSDATIGELLGQARRGVTARHYIRRPDDALLAAADRVSSAIQRRMRSRRRSGAKVIDLRKTVS